MTIRKRGEKWRPRQLLTKQPVPVWLAEMFLRYCDRAVNPAHPLDRALGNVAPAVLDYLHELEVMLHGRTQEEILAELQAEYEREHADWVQEDDEDDPEPQPPNPDQLEAQPQLFDDAVTAELLTRINAIRTALTTIETGIAALDTACGAFRTATDKLTTAVRDKAA